METMRILAVCSRLMALGVLVAAACGEVASKSDGGNGDDAPPGGGDFTLTADQSALTIPIAGSATVNLTIARTGSVGDIQLTAEGLGSNLMVEFAPNPIGTSDTTSQATIRVAGGSQPGTSQITLTATAGDKTHSVMVSVTTT